ncbi:MAG: CpsD/CapB family tyrosine-protein kinase [Roseburia sp.]|nr:CpsD/CapB family tyrosine-protein kinase [Roseburia sp.]
MKRQLVFEKLEKLDYATREAFNSLRTNLQFCGDDVKVVMFTSCTPNEGKSTVTTELCRSLGEDNKKVILIDADLRKSVMVGHYGIRSESEIFGLSHYLSGQKKKSDVIYPTNLDNVDMILAGPVVPNPTELLGNHYFSELIDELRQEYDMVLVDCPPIGWVIDAAVIGPKVDGAIIVIESGAISYRFLQDIKKQIELTGCRILGAVVNKVERGKGGYYNRYYGGKYGKYGKYSKYGSKYGQYEKYGEED